MYGALLLVFVVILSGALSYYGDVVGRKLGKKRLTIGKLRPRHTAAVMTALFGMIGSSIAIGTLLIISEPVRAMLFEGDQVRLRLSNLQGDMKVLKGDLAQRQGELEKTQRDVKTERQNVQSERSKLAQAKKDVSSLRSLAQSLRQQAQLRKAQIETVRRQLLALKPQYEKLRRESATLQATNNYLKGDNKSLQDRNLSIEKRNRELERDIKDKESKLKDLESLLKQQANDLKTLKEEYERQEKQSKESIAGLQGDIKELTKAWEEANLSLQAARAAARQLNIVTRTQPQTFARGDELARIQVRDRLNSAEGKSYLLATIEQASAAARARGAQPVVPNGSEAVLAPLDDGKRIIPESELFVQLVEKIAGQPGPQVLIASAIYNSFRGEPVGLVVRVLPNPVVYRTGQTILEGRFDGTASQDQIVLAITQFLQDELAPKAIKDGLLPALGQANPLGEVKQDELLKLVAEIKSRPFVSRVRFVAAQETRAGDRIRLDFKFP